jgi:AraC family transcriptional activator of pobA
MKKKESSIPYHNEINEFLESLQVEQKTNDPNFLCLRLKEFDRDMYKPPFRRGFYFVGLLTNAKETRISYDNTSVADLDSLIVFQSPGLIYSFYRSSHTSGYLIYFKSPCFSYFRPSLNQEFPFFNSHHTDFFKIDSNRYRELAPRFEEVFVEYEKSSDPVHKVASLKLLTLLYHLKEYMAPHEWQDILASPQQVLFKKFSTLVNTHYIEKKTVEEYADMLSVTANYLSQSVKSISGKNALAHISDRVLTEAKSLIRYTDFDIAEIAYRLNFSDPTNFGKFFKKQSGITPLEFRKKGAER